MACLNKVNGGGSPLPQAHGGVASTTIQLRQRFWVIHARQEVKVICACFLCKRFSTRPVNVQHAPLPADRLIASRAFEVTGLYFSGPLYVKNAEGTTYSKTYVLLFMCATTRQVHLELTTASSLESFLLAFHRFLKPQRGAMHFVLRQRARVQESFKRHERGPGDH